MIVGIEIEISSGNVFADLGLADAEKLKIKFGLVIEITRALRRLGLMQEEGGRRMGIAQPKVSAMMRGDFVNPSKHKRMDPPCRHPPRIGPACDEPRHEPFDRLRTG